MAITHFHKENLTALCGQGFYHQGFITTADSPSCWMCWEAWEKLPYDKRSPWHLVKMNGKYYPFKVFADAVAFAVQWNGVLLTPIVNP